MTKYLHSCCALHSHCSHLYIYNSIVLTGGKVEETALDLSSIICSKVVNIKTVITRRKPSAPWIPHSLYRHSIDLLSSLSNQKERCLKQNSDETKNPSIFIIYFSSPTMTIGSITLCVWLSFGPYPSHLTGPLRLKNETPDRLSIDALILSEWMDGNRNMSMSYQLVAAVVFVVAATFYIICYNEMRKRFIAPG